MDKCNTCLKECWTQKFRSSSRLHLLPHQGVPLWPCVEMCSAQCPWNTGLLHVGCSSHMAHPTLPAAVVQQLFPFIEMQLLMAQIWPAVGPFSSWTELIPRNFNVSISWPVQVSLRVFSMQWWLYAPRRPQRLRSLPLRMRVLTPAPSEETHKHTPHTATLPWETQTASPLQTGSVRCT